MEEIDINFKVLSLPLTSQTGSSEIEILCSNYTAHRLNLVYSEKIPEEPFKSGNVDTNTKEEDIYQDMLWNNFFEDLKESLN